MSFKEFEMTKPLIEYLKANSLTDNQNIFLEVDEAPCGGRPDIVVVDGVLINVFEMKRSMSIKLLEQCVEKLNKCAQVWAVVGTKINNRLWIELCESYGIGLIEIDMKYLADVHEDYYSEMCFKKIRVKAKAKTSKAFKLNQRSGESYADYWYERLKPEFLYLDNRVAGTNTEYITQKRVVVHNFFKRVRSKGWFHPSEERVWQMFSNYSYSPITFCFNTVRNNRELFETKREGRKVIFKLKDDVDTYSEEYWFNKGLCDF